MSMNSIDFASLVTGFLTDYLPLQRCYSKNTILSYRDTLKLLLRYISMEKGINLRSFQVKDFKRELILEFLEWYRENGASCSAANQRLGAIKAFADYAQLECIEYISPLLKVSAIKAKKSSAREVCFLSVKQMSELINKPDINTPTGFRHRVILTLLYDSGCRVQELIDACLGDISFRKPNTIKLTGKGRKSRVVPISPKAAEIIQQYAVRHRIAQPDQLLFSNRFDKPLSRSGIAYILKKHLQSARQVDPTIFIKSIHPHVLRHSKAMHLLESGVNLIYIRDFLGHSSVTTTEIYAKCNPELKRKYIIEAASQLDGSIQPYSNVEKDELLEWLKNNI